MQFYRLQNFFCCLSLHTGAIITFFIDLILAASILILAQTQLSTPESRTSQKNPHLLPIYSVTLGLIILKVAVGTVVVCRSERWLRTYLWVTAAGNVGSCLLYTSPSPRD
eukprot:TRINITY_DN9228_c0_g1_i7.p1 TRINITY_DN9228_c0_g1~~TRINITY_DN9228_c0_g1_i7.p1  ORF type:complete len:110 (-),score=3.84 TRINITY_DN9228_c0_g1_i7:52-381(-)